MKRLLLLCLLCSTFHTTWAQSSERNITTSQQILNFAQVVKILELNYVDTLNVKDNVQDAIGFMLHQIDPYTEYYPKEETESFQEMTSGKYAGVGSVISFNKREQRCMFSTPYEGKPAANAGIKMGDIIMAINGKEMPIAPSNKISAYNDSVSKCLRGEPGTQLSVTVKRYGEKDLLNFNITRASIAISSIKHNTFTPDQIGYIKISGFTSGTANEMEKALNTFREKGAKGLIVDLRQNSGGLVSEALKMVNFFLPKNVEIVALKGKEKRTSKSYFTEKEPIDEEIPIVVLVDKQSASASEILAGALQDYDRAVIMGQRTYGKGLVQSSERLSDGSHLKFTTAKYYIPSGRCVQAYKFKDGEPVHLPDSLAKDFHTKGGRLVKDCGGIDPDIILPTDSLPNLIFYLENSHLIEDYVAKFRTTHKSIEPADKFSLSNEEYADFIAFLKENKFTYDQVSLNILKDLRNLAKAEGYEEVTKKEFDALEAKLKHDENHDYKHWEKEVRGVIERAIVTDYYYEKAPLEYQFSKDTDIKRAIEILNNPKEYKKILK